ncbi:hypothetical protein [Streptomyces sp. BA2]|uniref:hypothetical protein n=1 Tax=Streptomyces sp. BA2 TaxID=436595 RepID=UPI0013282E54|nr:hypothetical protein [Streptomyces sp. BA2]MWA11699.1 hypothetical protein [Streptomyces sp. BA2]
MKHLKVAAALVGTLAVAAAVAPAVAAEPRPPLDGLVQSASPTDGANPFGDLADSGGMPSTGAVLGMLPTS